MNEASRVPTKHWVSNEQSARRLTPEELKGVQEAIASFDKVGGIPVEEVEAWLDSFGTGRELPEPEPRQVS